MTRPAKILGVDDEADFEVLIRQRFRRQIRDREFTFCFARHGQEALDRLLADPDIDLMLLDINMPVMDGLTLLTELRERQSPVRAIIVSAYGDMTNLRTASAFARPLSERGPTCHATSPRTSLRCWRRKTNHLGRFAGKT